MVSRNMACMLQQSFCCLGNNVYLMSNPFAKVHAYGVR
jgi:hypothetical protein